MVENLLRRIDKREAGVMIAGRVSQDKKVLVLVGQKSNAPVDAFKT